MSDTPDDALHELARAVHARVVVPWTDELRKAAKRAPWESAALGRDGQTRRVKRLGPEKPSLELLLVHVEHEAEPRFVSCERLGPMKRRTTKPSPKPAVAPSASPDTLPTHGNDDESR